MKTNKNIHILPTDKPSRLCFNKDKNKFTLKHGLPEGTNSWRTQNIYITSDEEIKEGDCVYHTQMFNHIGFTGIARVGKQRVNQEFEITSLDGQHTYYSCKEPKVVLTTDQDLIKDGVQAIDDEFLEWFVKNPSCENVEVIKTAPIRPFGSLYKIIIPKEEAKKKHIVMLVGDKVNEEQTKCYCGHTTYCDCGTEVPKQETLEEASLLSRPIHLIWDEDERYDCNEEFREEFKKGAKWQQERSYSEEEVIAFGEFIFKHSLLTHTKGVKNLLEQFKNK